MFLLWLLMRRLALGLPTVLQLCNDPPLLFHEHGVCEFAHPELKLGSGVSFPDKIWALVDSNRLGHVMEPAMVLLSEHFFVVKAVPFSRQHLQWMDALATRRFIMSSWSSPEVLHVCVEIPPAYRSTYISCSRSFLGPRAPHTEHRLWHLHHEYGAPPMALAIHAPFPCDYEEAVITQINLLNRAELLDALESPYLDRRCHLTMLVEPSPTSRSEPRKRFASTRVAEMFRNECSKPGFHELCFRCLDETELIALLLLRRFSPKAVGVPKVGGTIECKECFRRRHPPLPPLPSRSFIFTAPSVTPL